MVRLTLARDGHESAQEAIVIMRNLVGVIVGKPADATETMQMKFILASAVACGGDIVRGDQYWRIPVDRCVWARPQTIASMQEAAGGRLAFVET